MWRRLLAYELEEEQKMVMSRLDRDINLHVTISCHDQKFIFQLDSLFLQLIFLNIWQSVSITPLPVRSCCFSQNSYFIFCNPDVKRQVQSMQTTTDWEEMFDTGKENHHHLPPSNCEQSQNQTKPCRQYLFPRSTSNKNSNWLSTVPGRRADLFLALCKTVKAGTKRRSEGRQRNKSLWCCSCWCKWRCLWSGWGEVWCRF